MYLITLLIIFNLSHNIIYLITFTNALNYLSINSNRTVDREYTHATMSVCVCMYVCVRVFDDRRHF